MDRMFEDVCSQVISHIEYLLSNDDFSDDDEMFANFVEIGLTEEQARHALTYRDRYALNTYLSTATPIRRPDAPLRFDPHKVAFVPE